MLKKNPLRALLPFWIYILLFKFGAGLHYTLLVPLGERIMPIWVVGLIIGGAAFLQLLFDVPAGLALDRFGYVRILRLTTLVFLLGGLTLLFGLSMPIFLLSVFFGFIGWLFFGPGVSAYTLASAKPGEGGKYMGLQHAFASLGVVLCALAVIWLVNHEVLLIGIVISILLSSSWLMVMLVRPERASVHAVAHRHQHYYIHRHFLHRVVAAVGRLNPASLVLALQNVSSAIFYAIVWFVVPLVIAHQIDSGVLGIGLGMFDLAVVLLGAWLGRLADRYSKRAMISLGLLLFTTAALLLGFNFGLIFLLLGFLATTGDEMSSVALWSWLEQLDKDHSEDGLINSLIALFDDIGWTLGPIIAGFLFNAIGPSYTIALGAIPISLVWIFSMFFLRQDFTGPLVKGVGHQHHPRRHRHKK